jgi:hypothetical protein
MSGWGPIMERARKLGRPSSWRPLRSLSRAFHEWMFDVDLLVFQMIILQHTVHSYFRQSVDRLAVHRAESRSLHHKRGRNPPISNCVSCICLTGEAECTDNRTTGTARQTARHDILYPDAAAIYRVAALSGIRPPHVQQLQCD